MSLPPRLYLVQPRAQPDAFPTAGGSVPPVRPRRPAAAVRKSLRTALAASAGLVAEVDAADARYAATARRAVQALQGHANRLSRLTAELHHAVECEVRYHLWQRGRPYVD